MMYLNVKNFEKLASTFAKLKDVYFLNYYVMELRMRNISKDIA